MIPTNRLLIATLFLLPFACLPAVAPPLAVLGLAAAAALFVLVLVDLLLSRQRLETITLRLPEVIRMSKDREALIPLRLERTAPLLRSVVLALDLPASFDSPSETVLLPLAADAAVFTASWPAVPRQRGRFRLTVSALAALSRFGFWEIRACRRHETEIRVYPNLFSERKNLAALFLNRAGSSIAAPRLVGQGREFEKLREYLPGDAIDSIHWKVTAKRNMPTSKVYQLERTQEVYVLLDTSRLSGQMVESPGRQPESQLEYFMKAALVMGLAAQRQGDLLGLLTFSSQVKSFLRAKGGKSHYTACRDQLYLLEAEAVNPDFRELSIFVRQNLKKRSLLVIFTSLDDPVLAEDFITSLNLINRQHLILVLTMNPATARPLFSDAGIDSVGDIHRHLAGHIQDRNLRQLEKKLRRCGVRFERAGHEALSLHMVRQYLSVKARQLL